MKLLKLIFLLGMFFVSTMGNACTSAIISGRLTADGRPILWKSRDTETWANSIGYYQGTKYRYIAIVDSKEYTSPHEVWGGTNEAGFSIINTLSYNLTGDKENKDWHHNGVIMKMALESCATIAEFKHLLDTLSRPMHVASNYGVIDAKGGAAYIEVGSTHYTFWDVNQSEEGFLVRTNFSFSGKENHGLGYVRYEEAYHQIHLQSVSQNITPQWLLQRLSRSFRNPLMGIDLTSGHYNSPQTKGWFVEQDFIARRTSSCAVAIQGVKPAESPELTTMWVVLGYPPVTPVVPVWVKDAYLIPRILGYNDDIKTSLSSWKAHQLQQKVYSYHSGDDANRYFHWDLLWQPDGSGLLQKNEIYEKGMMKKYEPVVKDMYSKGRLDIEKVKKIYEYVDKELWKGNER